MSLMSLASSCQSRPTLPFKKHSVVRLSSLRLQHSLDGLHRQYLIVQAEQDITSPAVVELVATLCHFSNFCCTRIEIFLVIATARIFHFSFVRFFHFMLKPSTTVPMNALFLGVGQTSVPSARTKIRLLTNGGRIQKQDCF